MMKKLLFAVLMLVACSGINAQNKLQFGGKLENGKVLLGRGNFAGPHKAKGTIEFGYAESITTMIGVQKAETYDCAIFVPGDYAGMTIDGVYFYLWDKSVLKDVSGWASVDVPATADAADRYVALTTAQLMNYDAGPCSVSFAEPLTIPADGCYVGYSFTVSSATTNYGQYPVLLDGQHEDNGAFLMKTSASIPNWSNFYGGGYGDLVVFAAVTGDFADTGVAAQSSFGTVYAAKNSEVNIPVQVVNMGTAKLSNVSYKIIDAAGNESEEKTAALDRAIDFQYSSTVNIPFTGASQTGSEQYKIVFTKANGVENAVAANTSTGTLVTLSQIANRKVLEEEFTGTGCGWCPRGIVGMDECKKQIGDQWIGVALHLYNSSDPMYPTNYSVSSPYYSQTSTIKAVGSNFAGAPSCMINRVEEPDPFYGNGNDELGIIADCKRLAAVAPAGKIAVEAEWKDADSTLIKIKSSSQFFYNADNANFAVAYYIIADEMYGSTWKQTNYNYQYTTSDVGASMADWAKGGKYGKSAVSGITFNHVALAGIGVDKGLEGSISTSIVEDAIQTHEVTVDLSENKFFANDTYKKSLKKDCIAVIAFILDRKTGEIINAEECEVVTDPTAINDIQTVNDATVVARYNMAGQLIHGEQKGVNILKMSNGKTVKVIVK